jgi:transposase
MSITKTKPYPSEFKESSVNLAVSSGNPVAQTARELGIPPKTLYNWVTQYSKPKDTGMRTTDHIYDENKRLKKELAHVTQERDLLKKAAAYFAKEAR